MKLRIPTELTSPLSPYARRKLSRWVKQKIQSGESELIPLLGELGTELASELEVSYTIKEMLAISPEAVDALRRLEMVLESREQEIPETVRHVLNRLKGQETAPSLEKKDVTARFRDSP
jgi:hypothetical protein